jgi:hypothetical protein
LSFIEFASDCQAHVVGKPEADFFNLALKGIREKPNLKNSQNLYDKIIFF